MRIRPATEHDLVAMAGVESAAADHPWSATALAGTLALAHGFALVADDDPLLGHAVATAVAGEGELLTLAVHPSRRRQGWARALLTELELAWQARAVETAFLEVRTDNIGAIALYERTGWARCGERRRYYSDGCDALLMRRTIRCGTSAEP